MALISIPAYANVIDLPTSQVWREESGIVCAISKKVKPQSVEETRASVESFHKFLGPEKVCMLIDVTHSSESSRDVRAYAAEELPKMVKAPAMVSNSALGKMIANLFFNLKSQPYPIKMFNNENAARVWLNRYL